MIQVYVPYMVTSIPVIILKIEIDIWGGPGEAGGGPNKDDMRVHLLGNNIIVFLKIRIAL